MFAFNWLTGSDQMMPCLIFILPNSLKQHSTGRHARTRTHYPNSEQSLLLTNAACLAENQKMTILYSSHTLHDISMKLCLISTILWMLRVKK
jgi:hypothetical protein